MSVLAGNQNIGSRLLSSDAFQLPRKPQTKPPVTRRPHDNIPPTSTPTTRRTQANTPAPETRRPRATVPTTTTTNLNNNKNKNRTTPPPPSSDDVIEWSGVTEATTETTRRRGRKLSIEQTLARYTGSEAMILDGPKEQVERHEKTIEQVLDEMSGSLNIFRQQVTTFVTTKVTEAGIGRTNELSELQTFLGTLEPDMNRFIEACTDMEQIPFDSSLKKHFGCLVTLASAIQSFTVHHLRFAPNISASDVFKWLNDTSQTDERRQALSESRAHFELVKDEIRRAVNSLLAQRVFV